MTPFVLTRAVVSAASVLVLILVSDLEILTTIALGLYAMVMVVRGAGPLARLIGATLLMVLPLFLVHGIANPTFTVSVSLFGIPWRGDGASYAALVSLRMALLFAAVAIWMGLPRDVTLALLASSPMPTSVGLALIQALLMSRILARRVASIRLAQKSRGALREGGLGRKIASTVAMVVPLIATTLIDAHERGRVLVRIGVGSTRMLPPHPLQRPGVVDTLLASAILTAVLTIVITSVSHVHQ